MHHTMASTRGRLPPPVNACVSFPTPRNGLKKSIQNISTLPMPSYTRPTCTTLEHGPFASSSFIVNLKKQHLCRRRVKGRRIWLDALPRWSIKESITSIFNVNRGTSPPNDSASLVSYGHIRHWTTLSACLDLKA